LYRPDQHGDRGHEPVRDQRGGVQGQRGALRPYWPDRHCRPRLVWLGVAGRPHRPAAHPARGPRLVVGGPADHRAGSAEGAVPRRRSDPWLRTRRRCRDGSAAAHPTRATIACWRDVRPLRAGREAVRRHRSRPLWWDRVRAATPTGSARVPAGHPEPADPDGHRLPHRPRRTGRHDTLRRGEDGRRGHARTCRRAARGAPRMTLVVGHRGSPAQRPENTMPSFELAVEQGVDAIELDVHLTADGQLAVVHDATLERTTDLSGSVAHMTMDAIRAADAGYRFGTDAETHTYRGQGLHVPTLREVLDWLPDGVGLVVELKSRDAADGTVAALHDSRVGKAGLATVISFEEQ